MAIKSAIVKTEIHNAILVEVIVDEKSDWGEAKTILKTCPLKLKSSFLTHQSLPSKSTLKICSPSDKSISLLIIFSKGFLISDMDFND